MILDNMEKRSANNWYPVQVWLTFLLVVPISALIIDLFSSKRLPSFNNLFSSPDIIKYLEFVLLLGGPIFLVYFLSFRLLIQLQKSSLQIKVILNTICIVGIFISCYAFFKYIYTSNCLFVSVLFIVISFFYKIYKRF
jgi:hypothetical protein